MPKRTSAKPRPKKIPARFRALGGVDPRNLPPGTPYPCNDPAVGASVRGKQFAGKILGCATPPPGKRGRHFVVGGLESRSAIASAKRATERTREALRARYEGPDFDARPKRRAPRAAAPVAGPRPSTEPPRNGFLYGIYRMDRDTTRVRPDGSYAPSFRRDDALEYEYGPSAAAVFDKWWAEQVEIGWAKGRSRDDYWAWAVDHPRNKGDWQAENARLRLSRMSATYAPPTLDEDVARRRQRAKNRGLRVVSGEMAASQPSAVKRRVPEMDGPAWSPPKRSWQMTFEEFVNANRAEIRDRANQRLAASASKVKVYYKYNAPSSAGPFTGSMDVAASAGAKKGMSFSAPFGAATVTSVRRLPIVSDLGQAITEELVVAKEMYREAVRNAVRSGKSVPQRVLAEAGHRLPDVGGARWPTPKRTPEMDGPAWSPPKKKVRTIDEAALTEAILSQMEARGIPRSPKGAASIVSALLDHEDPEGALDTHNKNYRAIFSFFSGAKLPTTNKGTREFIQKGEFTLIPASLWGGGKAEAAKQEAAKQEAATLDQAYRLLSKSFLHVARIPYAHGEMPIPGQNASISEAVVTPPFVPKGGTQNVKVYVVRVHERPGVYAFIIRENSPQRTYGLSGGSGDRLGFSGWQAELSRAIEK